MFEHMDISESIYEYVVETSYKDLIGKTPTVLVTAGKREENTPRHRPTPRQGECWQVQKAIYRSPIGLIKNLSYP